MAEPKTGFFKAIQFKATKTFCCYLILLKNIFLFVQRKPLIPVTIQNTWHDYKKEANTENTENSSRLCSKTVSNPFKEYRIKKT